MKKFIVLKIVFLLLISSLDAQDSLIVKSLFMARDFGAYFLADHYAPIIKTGGGLTRITREYDVAAEPRNIVFFAEPVLGAQLPIFYRQKTACRFAISMPVSFSVWWDLSEERTAPILNTDYRFAFLEFNYSRNLNSNLIKNAGVRFIPLFHESTHIGDEYTLSRVRDSIPAQRINVSYETFELAFMINDPYNMKIRNSSFRMGAKFLHNPKKGYYTADTLDVSQQIQIMSSKRWVEPYIQYQFQNPDGWLSGKRMMFLLSVDFSLRVRYGYPVFYRNNSGDLVETAVNEGYRISCSSLAGWRVLKSNSEMSDLGVFLKAYTGINPHGQFRNNNNYNWIGLTVTYEP